MTWRVNIAVTGHVFCFYNLVFFHAPDFHRMAYTMVLNTSSIKKAIQKAKIPPGRIKKETTSKNTYENFQNARKIIDKEETEEENLQVAIVTSEFHLYRAQKLAEKHGFYDTIKISAPSPVGMYYPHFFREIAAVVASWYRY